MKIIITFALLISFSCSHKSRIDKKIKLYVFDCGENQVQDISIFSPGFDKGVSKTLVASCYLIKHPKGMFMWDTGLSDSLVKNPDGLKVRNGAFTLKVTKTLISQLKELNISPDAINFLGFSHMHPDHTGNAHLFKNATVIIQKEEYNAAFGKNPQKHSFNSKTYQNLKNNKFVHLNGDYDVFDDGTIVVKRAPGHTPGHQTLFVDLEHAGPIVLSGDLYHFEKNRKYKRVPSFNFSKSKSLQSMKRIENFISKKRAKLWIQHDPEQRKKMRLSPAFYK